MKETRPEKPPTFAEDWASGDPTRRVSAVLKRLAPGILFVVFMYFFTTFAGR